MQATRRILVTGADGALGNALIPALRWQYGSSAVITASQQTALDKAALYDIVRKEKVTDVYHLAEGLTIYSEKHALKGWEQDLDSLLNILDMAKACQTRVFWPSSIAVFGEHAPRAVCAQHAVTQPQSAYGIAKLAGESWCRYYHDQYGVDVRSIRYPILIAKASDILQPSDQADTCDCLFEAKANLPLIFIKDAAQAALRLMDADSQALVTRTGYNLAGIHCTPVVLTEALNQYLPKLKVNYRPAGQQDILCNLPGSIDDRFARYEWGWSPAYDLGKMAEELYRQLSVHAPPAKIL